MPADWIQARDTAFQSQAEELVATIATHAELWGMSLEELLPLQQSKHEFDAAMAEQAEKAAIYHAIVARKQSKRDALERTLRLVVRRINNHPGMTDELRQQMKLASPIRTRVPGGCRSDDEND